MSDLVERLRDDNSDYVYTERHEAAARITELETALAEAEGRVIAEVVAWLRDRKEMSGYYIDYVETSQAADILETGEWRNAQSV